MGHRAPLLGALSNHHSLKRGQMEGGGDGRRNDYEWPGLRKENFQHVMGRFVWHMKSTGRTRSFCLGFDISSRKGHQHFCKPSTELFGWPLMRTKCWACSDSSGLFLHSFVRFVYQCGEVGKSYQHASFWQGVQILSICIYKYNAGGSWRSSVWC